GSLTELAWTHGEVDVADVLTRRPEAYHRKVEDRPRSPEAGEVKTIHSAPEVKEAGLTSLLRYDRFRRASLLDGLFPPEGELDPLAPWDAARGVVGRDPVRGQGRGAAARGGVVRCPLPALDVLPLALEKSLRVVADEPVVTV